MAISGPKALRALDSAIRDIRREESQIARRLSRSAERLAKIREGEAELFRKLASVRLGMDEKEQIEGKLFSAEKAAREVLKKHASQISEAEKKLEEIDRKISDMSRNRQDVLEEMQENQEKLKILSDEISRIVEEDPEYMEKQKKGNELRVIAEEAAKKTEQAELDQQQKGQSYRQDPLFMYLWESGYGTKSYRANNLTRWLDGMVAKFIRYQEARPNFAMLNEIPLRLKEHAQRQEEAALAIEKELDMLEARAIEKAGGGPITRALDAAREKLDQIDRQMVEAEDERDRMATRLRKLAEGRDPAFSGAVNDLAAALQGRDLDELMEEARKTATGRDDGIVAKISDARARAFDSDRETRELRERLKVLEQRRRELEDIGWEFKKSRFDDPRSQFRRDELVGDLLGEFLRGAISAASYWGQWQDSQSWKAGTGDWGGSFGLPRGGRNRNTRPRSGSRKTAPRGPWKNNPSRQRSPWGAKPGSSRPGGGRRPGKGFSRPRSGSRGSRRSGGFKTGGGF